MHGSEPLIEQPEVREQLGRGEPVKGHAGGVLGGLLTDVGVDMAADGGRGELIQLRPGQRPYRVRGRPDAG